VLDADGNIIYDDTLGMSRHGDSGVTTTGTSTVPTASESVVTASVVDSEGEVVGTVRLWAFGSDALLTSSDAKFRESSYSAIAAAAAIAVVLAVIIGYFVSRSLTKPIQRITRTASQIRNGDLTARTGVRGTDEIGQLGETFDDMATSLEKDLKLEHRLTSDVAHELRTPLMAILATVEAMQDGVLPADDEHLETLASETRRLSRLVDAMLKLSRLENGTTELKVERTDVVYLVKSLVNSQHQLFHEKGLHLRFKDDTAHGECQADVDPDLIREAVVNLMSNAMRYTDEDGWVVVSVGSDHSDAIISVRDTGIGIAKEDIPQTFSRFWRSDVSRERVSGGLGVGLSITKEIVDRHNGTISVDSELGKGTTFTIRVPLNRGRRNLKQALQEKQQEK
jgi:signal transduction histidine kinase